MIKRSRREKRVRPPKDIAQVLQDKRQNIAPLSLIDRRTTAGGRMFAVIDVREKGAENNGRPGEKRTFEGRN